MRSLVSSLLGAFLTPAGLVTLAVLDSTLIFFLPLGIDVVLVLLAARNPGLFWAYALGATAGSIVGALATYWIGRKIGEDGLSRWVGRGRVERVRSRVSSKAAPSVAALGLMPPPFPFTAFILASGAFALDAWPFMMTLAITRGARFSAEAALAARFGERILAWMESTAFQVIVGGLIVLAVAGTIISAVRVIRQS